MADEERATQEAKTLYDLKLHECHAPEGTDMQIIRVPGGWLYRFWLHDEDDGPSALPGGVFVPYTHEFDAEFGKPDGELPF